MAINKKIICAFVFVCLLNSLTAGSAYGWWRPRFRKGTAPQRREQVRRQEAKEVQKKKQYQYIKSHDLNGDGVVNERDRLMWLHGKDGNYTSVYISEENADLFERMDVDGNGDVQPWEMQQFVTTYDRNKNGILEENEINTATD